MSLAAIQRRIRTLAKSANIDFEQAEVRRTSYGLQSPNKGLVAQAPDSHTEHLDQVSEDNKVPEDLPHTDNFFKILAPEKFNTTTYQEIVYNEKPTIDPTDKKAKLRCMNTCSGGHDGPINGIAVLDTGLVITSGDDKKIKFWNPMDNELLAIINENNKVGHILTFPKVKQFYYAVANRVKSFDYSIGVAQVVYEGMSNITCMSKLDDGKDISKNLYH